jgi:hypothetical protein
VYGTVCVECTHAHAWYLWYANSAPCALRLCYHAAYVWSFMIFTAKTVTLLRARERSFLIWWYFQLFWFVWVCSCLLRPFIYSAYVKCEYCICYDHFRGWTPVFSTYCVRRMLQSSCVFFQSYNEKLILKTYKVMHLYRWKDVQSRQLSDPIMCSVDLFLFQYLSHFMCIFAPTLPRKSWLFLTPL